jgi:hypothetical protein
VVDWVEVVWDGGAVESGGAGVVVVLLVVDVRSTELLVVAGGLLAAGAGGAACSQAPRVKPSAITAKAGAYPKVNAFIVVELFSAPRVSCGRVPVNH